MGRRRRQILFHNGQEATIDEWAARVGLSSQALYQRINSGWTIEEALTIPGGGRRVHKTDSQREEKERE